MFQRRKIEFVPSRNNSLNGKPSNNEDENKVSESLNNRKSDAKIGLFDPNLVEKHLSWSKVTKIGPGFFNDGNSCYLNSTLQCLLYLPPFVQVLRYEPNSVIKATTQNQVTMMHHFISLVNEVSSCLSGRPISPKAMVRNIKRVGKQFKAFRQEDAHEYLRSLLDCMHEEVLKTHGLKAKDGKITETTAISRVFGGYICNTLTCVACKYSSKTLNHFQDLSLEISGGISNLDSALGAFTKAEYLTKGNEWKCDKCKAKVKARKQMTLHKLPAILVIHFKRFSFGNMHGKIKKPIQFNLRIKLIGLSDYQGNSSNSSNKNQVEYDLCGVIVHHGSSTHSGHYFAYVKGSNGQWYEMNDSRVSQVSVKTVLQSQAYILFYTQLKPIRDVSAETKIIEKIEKPSLIEKTTKDQDVGEVVKYPEVKKIEKMSNPIVDTQNLSVIKKVENKYNQTMELSTESSLNEISEEKDNFDHLRLKELSYPRIFRFTGPMNKKIQWKIRSYKPKLYDLFNKKEEGINEEQVKKRIFKEHEQLEDARKVEIIENSKITSDQTSKIDKTLKSTENPQNKIKNPTIEKISSDERKPNTNILRQLINQSNRGKEIGGEGFWTGLSENTVSEGEKIAADQRKQMHREKKRRSSLDDWNALLDEGRTKKVKTKDEVFWDDNDFNPFQERQEVNMREKSNFSFESQNEVKNGGKNSLMEAVMNSNNKPKSFHNMPNSYKFSNGKFSKHGFSNSNIKK